MGVAKAVRPLTLEEYLALEREATQKHELVEGFPYAMAGASDRHNRVVVNLVLALGPLVRKKGCRLYASDMRLKVDAATVYYPDLMVVCEEDPGEYYKERPCLVIEVLSESTEGTDRREKLRKYLGLPTLQAYLLVDSRAPQAFGYYREEGGWVYQEVEEGRLPLPCLEGFLDLQEVYADL
ncbi:Uma2 family endonuclease [Thermus sediminis]|uniref:Uma2 family endonuclease n=1 Tax=Thermus sediminis TaxID=1761908 RepID=UPI000E3DB9C8|nr:Uma2 family endonuclease [Thermus sediminis]